MTPAQWLKMDFFKPGEVACRCGCGRGPDEMDVDFMAGMDRARMIARVPFIVTSGFRCPSHNEAVGGVPDSAHTKGLALDVVARDSAEFFQMVMGLLAAGFERIVFYPDHRVHVDADPVKPMPMAKVKAA